LNDITADYLETYGLVEMRELVTLVQHRHPDITQQQIRDAVKRLRKGGLVAAVPDEYGFRYQYVQ